MNKSLYVYLNHTSESESRITEEYIQVRNISDTAKLKFV